MNTARLRILGALMIATAVIANTGFALLGAQFDYPAILQEPAAKILDEFHGNAATIGALFALLAVGAALLIPIARLTADVIDHQKPNLRRVVLVAGAAAGIVQVIGLLRWPLLVPHYADVVTDPSTSVAARADAIDTFRTLHSVLGGLVGETLGYTLTATWTLAVVFGIAAIYKPGRWFAPLGIGAAALIATGVLVPIGVPGAGLANFAGYIAWSAWVIGFAVSLVRHSPAVDGPNHQQARPPVLETAVAPT